MTLIDVGKATLELDECGDGRALTLIHGSASDRRTWTRQRHAWCDDFRVITYSRRYHWPNDPIEEGGTYAMAEHVGDLSTVLDAVDGPATLVGHSYGGVMALLAAARWPDRVEAVVAVEPPALGLFVHVPPRPVELLKVAIRRPLTALGIVKLGAGVFGPAEKALERGDRDEAMRRLGEGILGRDAYADLGPDRRAQVRDNTFKEELASPEALPRLDANEIRSIRCPTLLVEGDRSPAIFGRLLDAVEELVPDTERVRIPGASHLVHEDSPARFNAAVESFLESG